VRRAESGCGRPRPDRHAADPASRPLCPGRRRVQSAKPTSALEAEAKQKLIAKSPLGVPWIEPEAIAPAVVFLASDEACMVSGATYDVTGGDSVNYNV
jgi:NAD(P)-dependent dehydrogenase (short-subunit alcohol dehydrogenase family)